MHSVSSLCSDLFASLREFFDTDSSSGAETLLLTMSASEYDIIIPVKTFVKSAFESHDDFTSI